MDEITKTHEILVAGFDAGGVTTQETIEVRESWLSDPDNAIVPPNPPEELAEATKRGGVRRALIEAMARNTVGLGVGAGVKEGHERQVEDPAVVLPRVIAHLNALASRDFRNDSPTFLELMYRVKYDEESCGLGAIEVSRNKITGQISGLYHTPGKRVRRRKDRKGWMVLPTDQTGTLGEPVQFYNFGEKVVYQDGRPTNRLQPGGVRKWAQNELLVFRLYTDESRDYGLPRDAHMMPDYAAAHLAQVANVAFYRAGGTPPYVVFVAGQETRNGEGVTFKVPPDTPKRMAQTLEGAKGSSSRVAFIPLPPGTKVDHIELGKANERDPSNVKFREDVDLRAVSAFRISGIFVGMTNEGGRYDAEVERALSQEQTFGPEQDRYEDRLTNTLLLDLGYPFAELRFDELQIEADAARRDSALKLGDFGILTRGKMLQRFGEDLMPEAKQSNTELVWTDGETYKSEEPEPGEVPYGWNGRLVVPRSPSTNTGGRGDEGERVHGDDQRGLQPGTGGRTSRTDPPEQVERRRGQLGREVQSTMGRATRRGTRRATRALPDD
jgi:hypothetical protein